MAHGKRVLIRERFNRLVFETKKGWFRKKKLGLLAVSESKVDCSRRRLPFGLHLEEV